LANRAVMLPGCNPTSTHQDQQRLRNVSELVQAVLQNLYPSLHRYRATTFVGRNRIVARDIWSTCFSVEIFCSDGLTHSLVVLYTVPSLRVTKPQASECRSSNKELKIEGWPTREKLERWRPEEQQVGKNFLRAMRTSQTLMS
jgi:hypothetical protein